MGDGGVACVPAEHIMEKFPVSQAFGVVRKNGKFRPKLLKVAERKLKMKLKKGEVQKSEIASLIKVNSSSNDVNNVDDNEEVEEGELGTLKWPELEVENGEFVPDKPRKFEIRSEIEKGEIVTEKWRKGGDMEKGEFVPSGRWRKGEVEKGEFSSSGKYRKGGPWRAHKEVANEEVVPERWRKSEVVKDDIGYQKMRRHDSSKDNVWRDDAERTPPFGKYSGEKEFTRSANQVMKRSSRWVNNQERSPQLSSKIVDEEGYLKHEYSNGKSHGREYSSGNRLKRNGVEADRGDIRHYGEFDDHIISKSRRISDDGSRAAYSEQYQRPTIDRSYKSSFTTRNSSDKYSSKQYDSSLSSRAGYDRHSPNIFEWSPRDRARHLDHRDRSPAYRDRSPAYRDRSPFERGRYHEFRRSPSYSERSQPDPGRDHDQRDWTPNLQERSPLNRVKPCSHKETSRKKGGNGKRKIHHGSKGKEDKLSQKNRDGRDLQGSAKDSVDGNKLDNGGGSYEKTDKHQVHQEKHSPCLNSKDSPKVNGTTEELLSMEEDMDICDTPPHVPVVADSSSGKWFYLDHFGVERGPSRLGDLKKLVEEGILVSDHLVKHLDNDRWVTIEYAVSPLVTSTFPSIISDSITQLVSPPEAPGNLLADVGDAASKSGIQIGEEGMMSLPAPVDDVADASETPATFHIDERVEVLLEGHPIIPGKELETVGEVLQMTFEHGEWEKVGNFEGFTWHPLMEENRRRVELVSNHPDNSLSGTAEASLSCPQSVDSDNVCGDWFTNRWTCKGGDWKRNDEASQDRSWRKKYLLNDGYPLCLMPQSGYEDPRSLQKDELYHPSSRRLDLPVWAFTLPDDSNDSNSFSLSSHGKPIAARGIKGTMLPVIRINTCVVKDHGSFVSEPRTKSRGKDRYSSRSSRHYSLTTDSKRPSEEGVSSGKMMHEQESHCWNNIPTIDIPKDRLCTADDLQLHLGNWYYLNGAGHEQGPVSSSELQVLADQGFIQKNSSVFRKVDKVWVPVSSVAQASQAAKKIVRDKSAHSETSGASLSESRITTTINFCSFDTLHPQFSGYTRGRLHELVMKSYRSREFAAAINEVLDPWINVRQPRKETEKHIYNPGNDRFQRSGKRARSLFDGSEEDYEAEEDVPAVQMDEYSFDNLYGDAAFRKVDHAGIESEIGGWGQLDGLVLARVYHFLRADMKSLVYAASTCKHWRSVSKFYKDISKQVDLSCVGPTCTDAMVYSILDGYKKEKIFSLVLRGCTNITSVVLEDVLRSLPSISSVDITGCSQFEHLTSSYPNINWVNSRASRLRTKSLKHINERTSSVFKNSNGTGSQTEDSRGLRDYLENLSKGDGANQLFRRSLYKRSKLFDARKSSSILSRGAHLRRLAIKKSENGYKRMEEFLSSSLKRIMKENTFDFFVPKVAEIEYRMKSGYYAGQGLSSVKEDICRMCREAIRSKNGAETRDMNHIITLFIRTATSLDGNTKSSRESDELMKIWRDESPPGFCPAPSKYKKVNKVAERKYANRSNGSSSINGASDYGDYASDREIKRRLSRLNKRSIDSGSETSDGSSEETESDSEGTVSESDLDMQSEDGARDSRGGGYLTADDGFDSFADDREWGARMTKASLVPPVTRKYEVIDHYVIVADHEEVERKMHVSLPDDYEEKLDAQKNGTEESDMEIPEVKDYKPRKQLGDEVLEQEVYGIDPYTHNLLLDSMPDESDWPLSDKHIFIEDVLLRTLNKQVRSFTGTEHTPMKYPLEPVIEDILKSAEENDDTRIIRVCHFMLNAVRSRPEDNYVAYRKGLGVVCNKEGGFGEDDFVVEFLGEVYPAWKWFEKQDGIRSLQKNSEDPAPEFYNIYLERPKGDADGYDLVVVDAMHKANYASRICHSCRPNCEAKVTAVDGQYQIGIYTVRPIGYGEEVTFDYNSVTESKEEYEASVCLCGSQVCRGSYLNLTGEGAFQKVLKECHGILDRHQLMLEACELNSVSEDDYIDLGKAGLGSCLLGGLPDWLVAYSARLVRFINSERIKLPKEILKHNLEEKRKYFAEICMDVEKSDAEVQAEGVYNQRLQNLALTLDKVRYVMRCVFGDPKLAPPPLERLSSEDVVSFIWKGKGSLVDELLQCMAPHMDDGLLNDLKSGIRAHDPSGSDDITGELRKSLIWLRDEVRNLPCTYKCRHDAAADLIHIYAFTKCFFRIREYKAVTSPPVFISPLDLGPKYSDKLGSGLHEYRKTYGENYCLGQLIYWHNQANAEPDCTLANASRGCLSLPDIGSFYAKAQKPSKQRIYGPRTLKFMLSRMVKQSQRPWPKDRIWSFENSPRIFGSPMLDAVLHDAPLDKDLVHWLKHRPPIFHATWDR